MVWNEKQGDTKIRQGVEDERSSPQEGQPGPGRYWCCVLAWNFEGADHPSCSLPLQRGSNYGSLLTTEGQFQVFAKTAYYKVGLGTGAGVLGQDWGGSGSWQWVGKNSWSSPGTGPSPLSDRLHSLPRATSWL